MSTAAPIGRVVATELRPSTPHQFQFRANPDAPVGIGAIVRVDVPGRVVYGTVVDGAGWLEYPEAFQVPADERGSPFPGGDPCAP